DKDTILPPSLGSGVPQIVAQHVLSETTIPLPGSPEPRLGSPGWTPVPAPPELSHSLCPPSMQVDFCPAVLLISGEIMPIFFP
uniref:Uncharacterized protein n=1 Tax=Mustela putorius furo TaxID=9669 RepID=M3Y5K2_MUSPF